MAGEVNSQLEVQKKHPGGRPQISAETKDMMLRKLEPYLKSGLSLRKALKEANIPTRTFYDIKDRDESFRSTIELFQQYLSVLLNSSIVQHLHEIVRKQTGYMDKEGVQHPPKTLGMEDLKFLWWFATKSNLCKEEYGDRNAVSLYDPEAEIQKINRIIFEATRPSKEILHN